MANVPLTDTIVHAVAQLVDDSNNNGAYREPSHADIEFQVKAAGLSAHDPKQQGQIVGKAKRVRAVLYAALEVDPDGGAKLVSGLLGKLRACGGFRPEAENFVGAEAIANVRAAFESEGFVLASDGSLSPRVLDAMRGMTLLRRLGAPEEVAAAVLFLASREAAYITGETLGVSGGMGIGGA